jgi:hypothetical protein
MATHNDDVGQEIPVSVLVPSTSADCQVGDVAVGLTVTKAEPPAPTATQSDVEAHEMPLRVSPVSCTGAEKIIGGDAALAAVVGIRTPTDAQSVATAAIKVHTRRVGRHVEGMAEAVRVRHPKSMWPLPFGRDFPCSYTAITTPSIELRLRMVQLRGVTSNAMQNAFWEGAIRDINERRSWGLAQLTTRNPDH